MDVSYATAGWNIAGISISVPRAIAFVVAIGMAIAIFYLLRRTMFGRMVRAVAEDADSASLVGIDLRSIRSLTFGLGIACVAVAGTLLTPFSSISPLVGERFTLLAFVIVVLGGLGNPLGAVVAGLLVGAAESVGGLILPGSTKELLIYAVFILALLLRPQGLFGTRTAVVG